MILSHSLTSLRIKELLNVVHYNILLYIFIHSHTNTGYIINSGMSSKIDENNISNWLKVLSTNSTI